jgi:hypothetical protein
VVRVVNATGEARAVRIDLTASSAEALVLSGEPDQGAPDEAFPAPVAVPVAVGPSGLELTLAPWSFTVIATRT